MGKKNKKNKEKKEKVEPKTNFNWSELLEPVTNARIVKTLEDKAREEATLEGEYTAETKAGVITVKKSPSGRLSWLLDGEKITRSDLYNLTKDLAKSGKEKVEGTKSPVVEDGPTNAETSKVYKKKQLLNILKAGQLYKKKIIKSIAAAIPGKKLTGAEFVAVLDDITGEETPIERINEIFDALK